MAFNQIALVTILTDDAPALARFYREALGFEVKQDMGNYVELQTDGVRFAVCARSIMRDATGHASYAAAHRGQCFELAFPCDTPEQVDQVYADVVARGAAPVQSPGNMPWNQRTAFFADPDGNIHELFADLPR
jgi:catechol 2,3-dioxygenase-like lactoylglutathione lyase family enzyme